ncbi:MAG TPA: SGNH/GDSL hydrolase family protein [Streptosporangiaceae bacterium]
MMKRFRVPFAKPRAAARRSPVARMVLAGALAAGLVGASSAIGAALGAERAPSAAGQIRPKTHGHWVDTWVSMPQLTEPGNLPPAPFTQPNVVFADATLRQTVRVTVGGQQLRLRFSNAFGGAALPITKVAIALPAGGQAGVSAIQAGTTQPVTFSGRTSVSVPVGAQIVSDPLNLDLAAGSNLTVTMYLAQGQATNNITSHPGSRTNSYMVGGDHVADADLPGAASVAHWYFLSGVEMWSKPVITGAAIVGDSLTDGRGSTTNGNDRWPDQLFDRLHAHRATSNIAILNQAAGGNRVLNDGLGPNALGRIDRDVLAQSGVTSMFIFEGVNDIGTADATAAAQQQTYDDLITAFDQMVTRAHAKGIRVYAATITPFGGNVPGYDDGSGVRDATRQAVNQWIRTSHRFDGVVDFDKVARDPAAPDRLLPAYDVGDHLHLNPTGYKALADAVPATLLEPKPLPGDFGFN